MTSYVPAEMRRLVEARAHRLCEYCLIHESDTFLGCQVDHIISEKHGGSTSPHFNRHSANLDPIVRSVIWVDRNARRRDLDRLLPAGKNFRAFLKIADFARRENGIFFALTE